MAGNVLNATGELAKKVFLCGPNGPTGVFTFVSSGAQAIYHASRGDGPNAAGAAAGLWGGLSGAVIGFIFGGPVGAFIGSFIGGVAAGQGAKALVQAFTPDELPKTLHPQVKSDLVQVRIDDKILGNYRRQPPIRPEIDHSRFVINHIDGHQFLYWNYEGRLYPVSLDFDRPNVALIRHSVGGIPCVSEFSMNANGDVDEWNPQKRERWLWKRE